MQLIAAVDENWGIGKDGQLLVSIPADKKRFRAITTGHTIIMGRKTLEGFPNAKPLKDRRNIVLTQRPDYAVEGAEVVHSIEEAVGLVKDLDPSDVFCVGGGQIYRQMLAWCDTAHITKIDHRYEADAFFPDLEKDPQWEMVNESEEQVFFDLTYHFQTYRRISGR